jgi:hypothetical protein
MKNVGANFTKWTIAIAIAPFSLLLGPVRDARAADVSCPQNAPMVKNLRAYSSRCIGAPAVVPHQLTTKEAKRLTVTAKSANDHLTIAKHYEAEADRLDAQAAGYEEAAAGYRHSPSHVANHSRTLRLFGARISQGSKIGSRTGCLTKANGK